MCGRYSLSSTPARINSQFSVPVDPDLVPSYNVPPGTNVLMICCNEESGERQSGPAHWGFTPGWLKPGKSGFRPINARAESVASKPMFRRAFERRRCILPADGFYEWKALPQGKQPWFIKSSDDGLFGIAAIYEQGNELTGNRPSCAIVTTEANTLMQSIHDRMPVILDPGDYARWLDPSETHADKVVDLLRPIDADRMTAYPVSTRVNTPKNNDADLIRAVAAAG
jgi:putative SOS response-associated peptidase YedK